jgi:UDP-2-acetamido-3-amino-2,3-dideoxy-glucuronate N-acetyltransferase
MSNPEFSAHATAVIDPGCEIGKGTAIWHFTHIMPGCRIGENCNIGQNVVVSPHVSLGNNVKVQNNVSIYSGVICEDDVFLGPSMVFTNVTNPRSGISRRDLYEPTLVKKGATIGANATILCGITLGEYCFIGAGAVVTGDVEPYALVVGNPARHTGWMSESGHKLVFDQYGMATCPESLEKYTLVSGSVKKIIG